MKVEVEKVYAVFELLYNDSDREEFLPIAELAADCTSRRLTDTENIDPRIYYLGAAEMLCRVLEIKAARERLALTRTGAVPAGQDFSARLEYARQLYRGYESMCADIIRDDGFIFLRMGELDEKRAG